MTDTQCPRPSVDTALARGPQDDDEKIRPLYNHFFHLKNRYGPTAAASIMISAMG